MKRSIPFFLIFLIFLIFYPTLLQAATFNVSTAAALQTALTTAQNNTEDDIINLAAGSYNTSGTTFNYTASLLEDFSITLNGEDPISVILDGSNNDLVCSFDLSGIFSKTKANVILQNLTIQNGNGGGLNVNQPFNLTISRSIFSNNTGATSGGAIFTSIYESTILISNSLFTLNGAIQGSAIYILSTRGTTNLINNTITANSSTNPFLSPPVIISTNEDTAVTNIYNNIGYDNNLSTVFSINDDGDGSGTGSAVNLYNNLYGEISIYCLNNPLTCTANVTQSNNLPGENPLFVSSSDFQLQSASLCIDAGDPSAPSLSNTDLLGNPRTINDSVDMGAYQSIPTISASASVSNFGNVTVDESSSSILTISNGGNHSLSVSAISLSDTTNFSLDVSAGANPCTSETPAVSAASDCTVGVTFTPNAEGAATCIVTITSDDPNTPTLTLTLSGTGTSDSGGSGGEGGGGDSTGANPSSCSLSEFSNTSLTGYFFSIFSGIILMQGMRRKNNH